MKNDKKAQKLLNDPQFQKNWTSHMKSFGPILKDAFAEDPQGRVTLCAALTNITGKKQPQALLKLNSLQKHLVTDADKAAFFFAMGLFCEYAGKYDEMAALYNQANDLGHSFYLPYMKAAKYALDTRDYGLAEKNYRAAIRCFPGMGLADKDKQMLATAHTNLASCLVMMHRYDEAEEAISHSCSLYPDAPGRAAVEAVLYAIRDDRAQVETCLATLKGHAPAVWEGVKESTDKILAHADPKFFPIPLDEEKIAGFWHWFTSYSTELHGKLDREEYEAALTPVSEKLLEVFPFLKESPNIALGKNVPERVAEIVSGVAEGCVQSGAALIGGETAEHPGLMPVEDYDLAGFAVGIVDKKKIIDKARMNAGDVVIALASTGIHSNGFSLCRKVFDIDNNNPELYVAREELGGKTIAETLLTPTKIYVKSVLALLEKVDVKGISHITGGGFYENIPRSIPDGLCAKIDKAAVKILPIFDLIASWGNIPERDMFNTYNMGVGMSIVVPADQVQTALEILKAHGEDAYVIGCIIEDEEKVILE